MSANTYQHGGTHYVEQQFSRGISSYQRSGVFRGEHYQVPGEVQIKELRKRWDR
jgi:hypothetical protein